MSQVIAHKITAQKISAGQVQASKIGSAVADNFYFFKAVDQYADIAAWQPNGFPYSVSWIQTVAAGGVVRVVVSSPSGGAAEGQLFSVPFAGYESAAGAAVVGLVLPGVPIGQQVEVNLLFNAEKVSGVHSRGGSYSGVPPKAPVPASAFTRIGSYTPGASYASGPIRDLRLTDSSPIQGREYMVGDNSSSSGLFGQLNNAISVSGVFDIEMSLVRAEAASDQESLLGETNDSFRMKVFNTDHSSNPDKVNLRIGGTNFYWNALTNVEYGQHYTVRVTRSADNKLNCFIDDFLIAPPSSNTKATDFSIDLIGSTGPASTRLASTIADVKITSKNFDAPKAFYSWSDVNHSAVVDSAELTASNKIGSLVPTFSMPTDFNASGVSMPGNTFKALQWSTAFLTGNGLDLTGFTMHFEIEAVALDASTAGSTENANGDTLGALYGLITDQNLGFYRLPSKTTWSNSSGKLPVKTDNPTISATHINYDFSVTKIDGGYQLDVYLERTLWYSCQSSLQDFSRVILLLSGGGGAFAAPTNPVGRIKNALIINAPVDPFINTTAVSCVTVGDSNMALMDYQFRDPSVENNPLITGNLAALAGLGLNSSASVFLNSELQSKGVTAADGSGFNKIFNGSESGWSISPNSAPTTFGATLETLVDRQLGVSVYVPNSIAFTGTRSTAGAGGIARPPQQAKYWFSNMGGNDIGLYIAGSNNGYPDLADWVTYICDLYLTQISRMLASSPDAKVFVVSPVRQYTATDWTDASTYSEQNASIVSALVAEFASRLPSFSPGRLFFKDLYTGWVPEYNASPTATSFNGIHFNVEGYRQQALALGALVPDVNVQGVYNFPLEKNASNNLLITNTNSLSGVKYNGAWTDENWTYVPGKSRHYRMNEGSGLNFFDAMDESAGQDNKATLAGTAPATGWNYEP